MPCGVEGCAGWRRLCPRPFTHTHRLPPALIHRREAVLTAQKAEHEARVQRAMERAAAPVFKKVRTVKAGQGQQLASLPRQSLPMAHVLGRSIPSPPPLRLWSTTAGWGPSVRERADACSRADAQGGSRLGHMPARRA